MKTQNLIDLAHSSNLDRNTFESILFSERRQSIKILADREDIPIKWRFEAIEHNFGPNYSSSRKLKLIVELSKKRDLPKSEIEFLKEKKLHIELQVFKNTYKSMSKSALEKKLTFLHEEFKPSTNALIKKEIFLEKLIAIRDDGFEFGSEAMERARLLVEHLDSELFSNYLSLKIRNTQVSNSFLNQKFGRLTNRDGIGYNTIIQFSIIVNSLLNYERVDSQVVIQNSILLNQGSDIFGPEFRLHDNRIVNWPAPAFASFILLLPWDSNTTSVSKTLFAALTSFIRGLSNDVEYAIKEACSRRDFKEFQTKEMDKREIEQSRRAQEQKRIAELNREEKKKQKAENERLERDYGDLSREIFRRFPWSVPSTNIHPSLLLMLERKGFEVIKGRVFFKRESSHLSIFENFAMDFPNEKRFLVLRIQEFMRYVDHKARYLIDAVYLELKFAFGVFRLRVDQVAMIRERNQMYGCWAITMFGIPQDKTEKFHDQGWRPLASSNFFPKSALDSDEVMALKSVYFVKKRTEQGARSAIGKLIEMLEFDLDLDASEAQIEIVRLSPEEEKHRNSIFEQALQRTFWKGERSTGSGLHRCLECKREIWDAPSLARGFGPDCWDKIRYTERGFAVLSTSGRNSRFNEKRDALALDLRAWIQGISRDFIRFTGRS